MFIITITGASGVGKSTLEKNLLNHFGGGRVKTITTRFPRDYENGDSYNFQTRETFDSRKDFLWKKPLHGNYYAVTEAEFYRAANENKENLAFISLSPDRHEFVRNWFIPRSVNTLAIHLVSPGDEELSQRLVGRGDSYESITKRLIDSKELDLEAQKVFELHFIKPGTKEEVFKEVLSLYKAKTCNL